MKTRKLSRAETSRINGAKSRGPVTAEGKARSSRNALTHGLAARFTILAHEDPEAFCRHWESYRDVLTPANTVEEDLVFELSHARWRQRRLWGNEAAVLDDTADRLDASLANTQPGTPVSQRTRNARTCLELANRCPAWPELVRRYDATYRRIIDRTLANLALVRTLPPPRVHFQNPQIEPENRLFFLPPPAPLSCPDIPRPPESGNANANGPSEEKKSS